MNACFSASENILDFFDHMASAQLRLSAKAMKIIENAYKKSLLNDPLYLKMKGLGFRNILAHEYSSFRRRGIQKFQEDAGNDRRDNPKP